ncbi:hypothetical protein GC197_00450 [bacterium]|nr:hypothetical protein [bacterium]
MNSSSNGGKTGTEVLTQKARIRQKQGDKEPWHPHLAETGDLISGARREVRFIFAKSLYNQHFGIFQDISPASAHEDRHG